MANHESVIGPDGPVHLWLGTHPNGTLCGLPSKAGMVGTVNSLHMVTCNACGAAIAYGLRDVITNLQTCAVRLRERVQSCRNVLLNHARQNPTDTTCKLEAEDCLADLEATR